MLIVGLGFMPEGPHRRGGGLVTPLAVNTSSSGMPAGMASNATFLGGLTGLLPIGWIVLNIIFLQQLAEQNGGFKILGLALGHHRRPAVATAADRLLLAPSSKGRRASARRWR